VTYKGKSIFEFGDVSTCSFHATKLFHTGEGGAIFCKDPDLFHQIFYSHNFGHNGPLDFHGLGINGKISELQAAMGLAVLSHIKTLLSNRKCIDDCYNETLDFSALKKIKIRANTQWNYSYYPVLFENEEQLLKVQAVLNEHQIVPRRYFYPSLNTIDYTKGEKMPISESIARTILCLPLYIVLSQETLKQICSLINETI
jgi:dTDP-4-amino-4,6-dideoxygalactose transaminase